MSDIDLSQVVTDRGDLKKYRTEIPNIIDDLGLSVYQRTLYTHYKRVCGADGGTCTESVRTTGRKTKMSPAQVSISRRELADKGLIIEEVSGQTVHIQIIDIWELNFLYFIIKNRPVIDGWTVQQLRDWGEKCLCDKQTVYTVNSLGEKCLPHKLKKEHEEKKKPSKNGSSPKKDYLSDLLSLQVNGVSESTGNNPSDQWLAYRDETLSLYTGTFPKIRLNQEQEGELRALAGAEKFDIGVYREYVRQFALAGGYPYDVMNFLNGYWKFLQDRDIYKALGKFKPSGNDDGPKIRRNADGSYN